MSEQASYFANKFKVLVKPQGPSSCLAFLLPFRMRTASVEDINKLLDARYSEAIVIHKATCASKESWLKSLAKGRKSSAAKQPKQPRKVKTVKKQSLLFEELNKI